MATWATRDRAEMAETRVAELEAEVRRLRSRLTIADERHGTIVGRLDRPGNRANLDSQRDDLSTRGIERQRRRMTSDMGEKERLAQALRDGDTETFIEAAHEAQRRPEIVVLCGSTRFYDMFQAANYDLTMLGKIVLSVGFYPHSKAIHGHGEGVGHDSTEKVALDELHKRKIDLADRVYVLNVDGYIGESTRSEIDYAVAHGKPVDYLEATE